MTYRVSRDPQKRFERRRSRLSPEIIDNPARVRVDRDGEKGSSRILNKRKRKAGTGEGGRLKTTIEAKDKRNGSGNYESARRELKSVA